MEKNPKILIAGNTSNWLQKAKSVLMEDMGNIDLVIRHDFVGVIEAVEFVPDIRLCIVANKLDQIDDGLRIAKELTEPGDPSIILFTREISTESRTEAKALGIDVIDLNNPPALREAVDAFFKN